MASSEIRIVVVEARLLDRESMASALCLSTDTLDSLRKRGLPAITVPGTKKVLFDPEDVVAWMKQQSDQSETLSQAKARMEADNVFGN